MSSAHDAIIVGAGPAGSTAAILLASAGWSVALVEKQAFPRDKVCGACICASNLRLLGRLGVADAFARLAGPELREVAVYRGDAAVRAPLPELPDARGPWGRALGREPFDALLLDRARALGADIRQPWAVRAIEGASGAFRCRIEAPHATDTAELSAPVLVLANGSWEGEPGAPPRRSRAPGDLFAFKATFSGARLAPGILPVISFAGGYGGLVIADNGRLTFAGCVRRDALKAARAGVPHHTAGEAFERYLRGSTHALQDVLASARREGAWLGAGPIQPGIRTPWQQRDGRLLVGNAAAEAHPIIGEGISMAMQSAVILCVRLIAAGRGASADALARVGADYASRWTRLFAPRLRLAAALAHLAMRPRLTPLVWPVLARAPGLLTGLARGAGKARAAPDS